MITRPRWLVTCSCGWERECSSEWAARSVSKLHPQLAQMDVSHVTRVEGPAVAFEARSAEDNLDRLPRLAAELVHSKVDVIVAVSPPAILAARQATATIPIIMAYWGAGGLIESGIVANFARPGGNVTG